MRIFYAAGASPNAYHISDSKVWKYNLFDALVDLGHEVIAFSKDVTWHFTAYLDYQTSPHEQEKFLQYKKELQVELMREITAQHRRQKIDLFFSYFWSEMCEPETIERIKMMGIKTVNWFCNGSYQFHLIADLAPHYNWCLVPEKFRLQDYIRVGARPIYCQEAANPQVYMPYDLPLAYDVTFIGQAYGDRPAHVKYLLEQGINVRVWGDGWRRFAAENARASQPTPILQRAFNVGRRLLTPQGWQTGGHRLGRLESNGHAPFESAGDQPSITLPAAILGGTLSDMEMIQMYSRSKINLGFSTCGNTHQTGERIVQIRLRDFEVPMSGGFYLVEYIEELEEFFEIGKEIVCYSDPEELSDKIKYYLRHDSERETIRRAGYERCLREHTWQKRFATSFAEMGLS